MAQNDIMSYTNEYYWPKGYKGIGSDIKWCGRHQGGKFCLLCRHHAKYKEWSTEWNWYYIISWYDDNWKWWQTKSNYKVHWRTEQRYPTRPIRYRSTGLSENDLRSVLRRGCRKRKKCRCISIVQRGNWYCPGCYNIIKTMAKHKGLSPHSIMVIDRAELKLEMLIMLLSGTL